MVMDENVAEVRRGKPEWQAPVWRQHEIVGDGVSTGSDRDRVSIHATVLIVRTVNQSLLGPGETHYPSAKGAKCKSLGQRPRWQCLNFFTAESAR